MSQDGVLDLAGEFVANFYHTIVGAEYADAVHLYKETATVLRGNEGARAVPASTTASYIAELHNKVKGSTANILSIDASQLKSQEIVITVVVSFASVQLLVVQTLVLEAEATEEEATAWYITSDNSRQLVFPQFGTGAGTARPARAPAAAGGRPAKQTKAVTATATPAAEEVTKPETVATETIIAASDAVAAAAVAPAKTEVPAAASSATAPAGEAKVGEVKLAHVKRGAKKVTAAKETASAAPSAATTTTTTATKAATAKPAAAAEAPKPAAPKTWANIAATSKPAEEAASPSASSAPTTKSEETVAAPVAATKTTPVAAAAAAAKKEETKTAAPAKTQESAAGEVTIFFRARSAVEKDAIAAKLAEFAPVKDLEVGSGDQQKVIATFTTTEDSARFCERINATLPFTVSKAEVTSAEVSRSTPESLRRSTRKPSGEGASTSGARGSAPRTGSRGPRTGAPAAKKE